MIQCINCLNEVSAAHFPVASQPDAPRLWLVELLAEPRLGPCIVPPAPRRASVVWTPQRGNSHALTQALRRMRVLPSDVVAFHGDMKSARTAAKLATMDGLLSGTIEI